MAGIEDITASEGLALKRIRFRKWGKLEAKGPASVFTSRTRGYIKHAEMVGSQFLRALPLPFNDRATWIRHWNILKARVGARPSSIAATAFVIEGWSPLESQRRFTVTFLEGNGRGIYQESFDVGPSYVRLTIPIEKIARNVDLATNFLVQIEPVGDAEGCDVVFGTTEFVALQTAQIDRSAALAQKAPKHAKVVVWDLDETLWTGTLVEDGAGGVKLRSEVRETILELDRRGILNSIASKNEEAEGLAALDRFGMREFFVCPQIGWEPKSGAISRISELLDLGIDSFIFVDDQPFERGEVRAAHPSITAMSETRAADLVKHSLCDVPVTPEGGQRRIMYQAEAKRVATFNESGAAYLEFLKSCEITLKIDALSGSNIERILELSQRTNQLNFFGTKYSRDDLKQLMADKDVSKTFVLICSDNFGVYGIIGFAVLDVARGILLDFFMSCRVQRKYLEHTFFDFLCSALRAKRINEMTIRTRRTNRNTPSFAMLTDLGFVCADETLEESVWQRSTVTEMQTFGVVRVLVDRST